MALHLQWPVAALHGTLARTGLGMTSFVPILQWIACATRRLVGMGAHRYTGALGPGWVG
jgi:hypothetical protein